MANAPSGTTTSRGFLAKLFDFSFEEFITLSIIKVIYVVLLISSGIGALFMFVSMATLGGAMLVLGLILAPVLFIVYVILARVWLEFLIVVFRIADNTAEIARNGRRM